MQQKLLLLLLLAIIAITSVVATSQLESEVDEQSSNILAQLGAEAEAEAQAALEEANFADEEALAFVEEGEAESIEDEETMADSTENQADAELDEESLLEVSGDDEEKPEHPTYVLPYPPVLPGHYTPLFNPYTNVNPLSTPFANYAAQPGAHPGVASAAAAQAGSLAAVNGQIAGAAGGYPGFVGAGIRAPWAAHAPVFGAPYLNGLGLNTAFAGQTLTGNPVPFSGYAGWIHPQNLNSAAVGENEGEEFPQFVEVATTSEESIDDDACVGCVFN